MDDIIAFVADLVDKGMAYESEGDVYFITENSKTMENSAINASKTYKSGQVIVQPQKMMRRNAILLDFALWKSAKPNEISWNSPWGKGRQDGILNAL